MKWACTAGTLDGRPGKARRADNAAADDDDAGSGGEIEHRVTPIQGGRRAPRKQVR